MQRPYPSASPGFILFFSVFRQQLTREAQRHANPPALWQQAPKMSAKVNQALASMSQ